MLMMLALVSIREGASQCSGCWSGRAGFATTCRLMLAGVAHKAPADAHDARDARDARPCGKRSQLMLMMLVAGRLCPQHAN